MPPVDPYLTSQITKFWRWWDTAEPRIHAELAGNTRGREFRSIGRRVQLLHRNMSWEVAPGAQAQHRLTLRPFADPDLREVARLWLAAAPPPDAIWEFGSGRPPDPALESFRLLSVDGELVAVERLDLLEDLREDGLSVETIELAEMRVSPTWDPDRERVNVSYWHPVIASLDAEAAEEIAPPAIAGLLGDEVALRWLGEMTLDRHLTGGLALGQLGTWIAERSATATGQRWVTERRRDQRGRHVAVRFNAAQKSMDLPARSAGLAVVLQRGTADVEGPDPETAMEPLRDLVANLDGDSVRLVEVSEATRLSVYFVSADPRADRRAANAWERRHPNADADVEMERRPKWFDQMRLGELGAARNVSWEAAPAIKTRGNGRLYRRARWIERNPRRLFMTPLLLGIAAVTVGVAIPSMAHEAALSLIGIAGLTGLAIGTYMAASTYVTLRNNAALGILALLFDAWRILVIFAVSLALVIVYLDQVLTT